MIVVVSIALGLGLRVLVGGTLRDLAHVHLRGEAALLPLLVLQGLLPAMNLTGTAARVAFAFWILSLPVLISVVWINRGHAGMLALGLGLALNLLVVVLNGGMPVSALAVSFASPSATSASVSIPAGDFVHQVMSSATRLACLGDVLPLPGPSWIRLVASPGDILLYSGLATFLAVSHAELVRAAN
jgi:hypothetical protein